MPKSAQITITYKDGRTELKTQRDFDRRKFSYSRYRRSTHWRELRLKVLERDGYRCQGCKATAQQKVLEVHHKTYRRVGRERMEDLITLCQRCHATEHEWAKRRSGPLDSKH